MRRCLTILVAASVIVAARGADAGLITNTVTSSNAAVEVKGVSGVSHTAPVIAFGSNTVATGTITVDLDVHQLHVPTVLTFNFAAGGANFSTDYTVTFKIRNLDAVSNAGRMNGFDISSGPRTGAVNSNAIVYPSAPTSDVFFVDYSGGDNISGGFRFGGLTGGGGTIGGLAQVATSTFTYRANFSGTGTGTSSLNFVANPEPTTLLLGSLVLAPAALVVRRRRKAAAELELAPV
jgi:hypothetical protein